MLDVAAVLEARQRVMEVARRTPLDYSYTFSDRTGAEVHLKLENLQRTGSFKIRGATNRIAHLTDEERAAGVVTASAGNHAQGVALAASRAGVDAKIVMPEYAPVSKVEATKAYGAEVVLHGVDYDEAQGRAHELEREEGRTYVHAFDDEHVMAGQGTLGLEIVEDCPDVDTVVVPVGGGGLISGIATAVKANNPDTRVVGVQAEGASAMAQSLRKGEVVDTDEVDTIADGIAVGHPGSLTFEVVRERVDDIVTVSDAAIARTVVDLLERSKTLVEGAGAIALAAVVEEAFEYEEGEVVVPALCGGNIDLNVLRNVITRGLVEDGRYLKVKTTLKDRPGALENLIEIIADARANIYGIQHERTSLDMSLGGVEVELDLETRGHEHVAQLIAELEAHGYEVEVLV
ncbi:threonine ammonia-lyase [Halosegnis marinus]|uniref:threonine ammonia-lyase n=1 Tax=Halosegnis marinus TaxID=3034023 RepID=A0ABD5ZNT1_9EURY|nr:threonine ammonia-lyase [Halosegnis sp. DT85]